MKIIDFNAAKEKKSQADTVNELLDVVLQGKALTQSDELELRALLEALSGAFKTQSLSLTIDAGQSEQEIQSQGQHAVDQFQGEIMAVTVKNYCKIRRIKTLP